MATTFLPIHVNGLAHSEPQKIKLFTAATATSPVYISATALGATVTSVKQSTETVNNTYWVHLSNSTALHSVDFIITYNAGAPLVDQVQHFVFPGGGYAGSISVPFAVPYWGGDPILGPAVATVVANGLPVGSFNFTVVA